MKALKGDPSDNIPGIPGIGEKTALQLIKEVGNLENLYKELLPDKLKEKLFQHKEEVFFSKELAQIKTNIPLDFKLKDCQWGKYDKEKAIQVLKNFEFYSLISRLP